MNMKIAGLVFFSTLFVTPALPAGELQAFTSDGCSSFPDGTLAQDTLWLSCCTSHDRAYWKGGSYDERLAADLQLEICVNSVGEPEIAKLMLAGVRVGGTPYLPTEFRWAYGWPWPRGYKVLSKEELKEVEALINKE